MLIQEPFLTDLAICGGAPSCIKQCHWSAFRRRNSCKTSFFSMAAYRARYSTCCRASRGRFLKEERAQNKCSCNAAPHSHFGVK
ncbi:hypothetical protein TNCV_2184801 [Trichonephila clavipes]|nr:hypothetical protein TNCV_2184801 [Trichonephila clavipes]